MNWKQFLKPNWKKIVIFLIIAYLGSAFIFSGYGEHIEFIKIIPTPLYWILFFTFDIMFLILVSFIRNGELCLFLSIFYWYLLSCLILWIYDTYFKKLKKKYLYFIIVGVVLTFIINIISNPCLLTASGCGTGIEYVKNTACIEFTRNNNYVQDPSTITVSFDVDADPNTVNTLQELADEFYGCAGSATCVRRLCACPGY